MPHRWAGSLAELDPQELVAQGIRGVILDIDNTLVAWDAPGADEAARQAVRRLQQAGLKVVLISNARSPRRQAVARALGVVCLPGPKPLRRCFVRAAELMGLPCQQVAVVGDQLWTDVLGARWAGMYAVLVNPLSRREHWLTRLGRRLERMALRRMARQGLVGEHQWRHRESALG